MESMTAVTQLSALAHETRLEVFRLLVRAGHGGLPAGEIAQRLGVALPTLSFHLRHLREANLVASRRDGRSIIYSANYRAMNDLVGFLGENCCIGVDVEIASIDAGVRPGRGEVQ
jgi:ArsR family transcriptional regulator